MSTVLRKDVPVEETWDLSLIYSSEEEMYKDAEKMQELADRMVKEYQGKLTTPETINACLDDFREVIRLLTLTEHYCDLAVSVDYTDTYNQERNDKMSRISSQIMSRLSFISSELCEADENLLDEAARLSTSNGHYLKAILREKPYRLNPETEKALTALSMTFNAPSQIYNMAKLADMKFPFFSVDGKEYPLGYSLFEDDYEYETDTEVRRSAFTAFSSKLREYENVTAAAYNTQVKTEKTMADLRGFDSVFNSLLFDQKVDQTLYNRQIDLIMEKLAPHMQ
ncbi:MAG: oligoendopeptidase F, partial [Lachnospiraceae bacterium]|nr:oligoendopeptidase F [Lachnospiraceae bacterium]